MSDFLERPEMWFLACLGLGVFTYWLLQIVRLYRRIQQARRELKTQSRQSSSHFTQ